MSEQGKMVLTGNELILVRCEIKSIMGWIELL